MSAWADMCDSIIEDLNDYVPTLAVDSNAVHRYAPWSPEELVPDGRRHLAVWPTAEAVAETAEPLALGIQELRQAYRVLVWEDSGEDRGLLDTEATATFLDLAEAVRERFYVATNQSRAGAYRVWYSELRFPARSSRVRFFEMEIAVASAVAFV